MTFLEKVIASKREGVGRQRRESHLASMRQQALRRRQNAAETRSLRNALGQNGCTNIIAEIKRASPSKGIINDKINVADMAGRYVAGGAAAISVLTEADYFNGSLDDLREVREAVELPILRKDFIVDEFQIWESAAFGADAILLIVAALTDYDLEKLLRVTRHDFGMDAIVEVHTAEELRRAADVGADIIGVNNRDLHSLEVSLGTSRALINFRPPGALLIAESGISSRNAVDELRELGYDGFLIGESLMQATDVEAELRRLAE